MSSWTSFGRTGSRLRSSFSIVFPLSLDNSDLELEGGPGEIRHDLFLEDCVLCQAGLCSQSVRLASWPGEEDVIVHGKEPVGH